MLHRRLLGSLLNMLLVGSVSTVLPCAAAAGPDLPAEARRALKQSAAFFRENAASHGGYVYYVSLDLQQRWGEGKVGRDTIFVQPPGTPTVGMAFLRAYEATGDRFYLDAAREAAEALVYGQLASGGWTQVIHFAPAERMGKYRNGKGGDWNASSLDDGQTQSALRMLMQMDRALEFRHAPVHEAALYGLSALLGAQFPSGAFPQVWRGPSKATQAVETRARYPDYDWRTEGKIKEYWDQYTLNDGLAGTVSDTLILAHEVYGDALYRAALEKLGRFLIRAQMPAPQPAWCQQYNEAMIPIWARRFEPPAVSGWESQDVMETLIRIARQTGQKEYLEPVPRALAYLKASLLPDGKLARYYEFQTNRPLYMDGQYRLTYDDSDAPSHYGWKQPARLDLIERAYHDAETGAPLAQSRPDADLESTAGRIIADLDAQGRWVSTYAGEGLVGQPKFARGFRYLSSGVFSHNVETLSAYLKGRPARR
jgi:PelA/Pel-15E family pectate lyase